MQEKARKLAREANFRIVEDDKGISIETMNSGQLIYRLHRHAYENPMDIWDDVYAKLKELDEVPVW